MSLLNRLSVFPIISILFSCNGIVINERLEVFDTQLEGDMELLSAMSPQILNNLESEHLSPKYDSIQYLDGELHASIVKVVNSCSQIKGNISIKGDTLILESLNVGKYACTSQSLLRMNYRIKNESNQKFVIFKK